MKKMRTLLRKGKIVDQNIVEEMKKYYWYHCIDLGNNIITDGDYDLRPLLSRYGFPADMRGMSVLDVGRGSGFFAFEFEKRGADVTATDIRSFFDWDFVGGEIEKEKRRTTVIDEVEFSRREIWGAFEFAKEFKGSNVLGKFLNVYDISPATLGRTFDLVFAGSITSHLRDPIRALECLHSVTRGMCIVCAPMIEIPKMESVPTMALVGTMDSDRRSWWVMNETCVVEMMKCANFKNIEVLSRIAIKNRRVKGLVVPHVVVRGYAD